MAKAPPEYTSGYGGYGPWPETDPPFGPNPIGGYRDGFYGRQPGGCYGESPTESLWLDRAIYPERPYPDNDAMADRMDLESRFLGISVSNATGRRNGPAN